MSFFFESVWVHFWLLNAPGNERSTFVGFAFSSGAERQVSVLVIGNETMSPQIAYFLTLGSL